MAEFKDRITAGGLKGRKLVLPEDESVRPSKNRVRQAAFNMLNSRVDFTGVVAADVCCGSGAWGLEASSRGCEMVFLVDLNVIYAERNVRAFGVETGVKVVRSDARSWQPPAPLGLVLADPPYGKGLVQALLRRRGELGAAGSWWCVETERDAVLDWTGFTDVEQRGHGGSWVWVGRQE